MLVVWKRVVSSAIWLVAFLSPLSVLDAVPLTPLAPPTSPASLQTPNNGSLRGRVVTSETEAPLGAANVVLRVPGQEGIVASTVADEAGRFQLTGIAPGRYALEISFINYAPHTDTISVTAGRIVELGMIQLRVQAIVLDALTAEVERPQVIVAPDRDIYLTDELPAAEGGVATELMASIPELEVDIDGSISLRGSSPQIYINGRPAPMSGESLNTFLEQFPADQIERIEVIANPSARFAAEGSGGIVNIVLKEGVSLGANGSFFANADSRGATSIGGQGSLQQGAWLLSANGSLRNSDHESRGYDLRQNLREEPNTFLRQDNWSDRGGLSGSGRVNAELRLSERSTIRARGSFSGSGSDSEGSTTTTNLDHLEVPTRRYARNSLSSSDNHTLDFFLGFRHAITPDRHTLDIEARGRTGQSGSDRLTETEFELYDDADALRPADLMVEDSKGSNHELSLRIDYLRPLGEGGQIEVGYHGSVDARNDERVREQLRETPDGPVEEITLRGQSHEQTSHAGYLTFSQRIGQLGIQLGNRVRWLDAHYEIAAGNASFGSSGFDFFPSANLTYQVAEGKRLRFSYSRRTRRPPASRLNPVDQSTDPLNRNVGNPDLEPQYTHSFGLDASASVSWGTLRLSPYYRRVTNDWARIQTVDEAGVSTRTWENLASQDHYGASMTASIRRIAGWSASASLSGRGERRDAANLSAAIAQHSFYWSVRGNLSGQVPGEVGIRANFSYTPAREMAQGRASSRFDSSIGLRKRLLERRLSLSLTAQDPFDLSRSTFESRDPTFIQLGRSQVTRRSIRLSATYNFGGGRGGGGGGRGGRR